MDSSRASRFAALSLVAIVGFTGGVSLGAVGCRVKKESVPDQERTSEAAPTRTASVPSPHAPPDGTPLPGVARAAAAETAAAPPATAARIADKSSPTSARSTVSDALRVRRLVVTKTIEKREPVAAEGFAAGDLPIYAFVELENGASEEQSIVVTFERDGQQPVGHIKLTVPGSNPRWRTWGMTRQIREQGAWTAVVRTADGRELARTAFDVAERV